MSAKTSARQIAYELLREVWAEGAYANLVWSTKLSRSSLSPADRAFATELAYGTLRHHGQLAAIIELASGRKPESLDPEVCWVLLLGCYQLTHMATATHAAVNESVTLVKQVGKSSASGLVNAVLRKISTQPLSEWLASLTKGADEVERLAIEWAHPRWIVSELQEALKREGAEGELEQLLSSHNLPARVTASILPGLGEISPEDERTPFSPIGVYLQGDPWLDERVRRGAARIQDEGSQLAALVCTRMEPLRQGDRVLDACSGPGGKSAVMASDVVAAQASLTSVEIIAHRARLVHDSLAGFHENPAIRIVHQDVAEFLDLERTPFDRILLDAPCLGLGALRRRPEARWTKTPGDKEALSDTQRRLLDKCLDFLAPDGYLTYVTCSPVVSETTGLISEVLDSRDDVTAIDTFPVLEGISRSDIPPAGVGKAVQLWPHRHGTDAMFIQILRKTGRVG